jgi:DNA-binding MarR family transcriptional regulator
MVTRLQLKSLQASRRYGIGRLLLVARRDFLARLSKRMRSSNDAVTQAGARLLPYIDIDGTRSVDLARRLGVSKQAVARLVRDLEVSGLLYREPDGADGRAFLVKFTEDGFAYLRRMHECIADVEREYEQLVGKAKMKIVRKALTAIAYAEDES